MILLPPTIITTAQANQLSQVIDIGGNTPRMVTAIVKFLYGSGGTSVDVYTQTSFDNSFWMDVFDIQVTTAAATKLASTGPVTTGAVATLTDGTLAANTAKNGIIGRFWRVKWTSVGTYAGATSLEVDLFGSN